MRNRSFCWARRARNAPEGSAEGGPKTDPAKDTKRYLFGGPFWKLFWSLGRLLGLSWGTLLPSCGFLAPEAHKGRPKGGPRDTKRGSRGTQGSPREAQKRLRGSQKCSGERKRGPRKLLTVPREPRKEPKTATEPRLQRGGSGVSFPPSSLPAGPRPFCASPR